ncbi:MAG: phytanoyl-CoA dioxygenase family protein [Actinomycetota bacterium]
MHPPTRNEFEDRGYVRIPGVVERQALDAVRQEYATALDNAVNSRGVDLPRNAKQNLESTLRVLDADPRFDRTWLGDLEITPPYAPLSVIKGDETFHLGDATLALLRNESVLDVIEGLIGPEIMASPNQHCRFKFPDLQCTESASATPFNYAATGFHVDRVTQIETADATPLVTCWIPMHDVDEGHGCLIVVPNGHKVGASLPWPVPKDVAASLRKDSVSVPARAGDVVLLHRLLPHASLPNRSNTVRWSFDFRYFPAGYPSDRPWYPSIQVRSRRTPGCEVTSAQEWRTRWNSALAALVADGGLVPGRREHVLMTAKQLADRWLGGNYPVAS